LDNSNYNRYAYYSIGDNLITLLWNEMSLFNLDHIKKSFIRLDKHPFDHCIIDNFFPSKVANQLSDNFPKYRSQIWHVYKSKIEDKKTCNNWNNFDQLTYEVFRQLNSESFIKFIGKKIHTNLYSDPGLHGGGWHIHANNGNLNPHLDYTIHPKTNLQRRINLIIYLEKNYKSKYGGHLGLWEHDEKTGQPGKLVKEVFPKFNRAIIFDTSQNSWHGLSKNIKLPKNVYRKSIAVYYLCNPEKNHFSNKRALFAPRDNQKKSKEVRDLIKMRSDEKLFHNAYKK